MGQTLASKTLFGDGALQLADAPQLGGLRVSLRLARHTPPRESPHT